MPIDQRKHSISPDRLVRDVRSLWARIGDYMEQPRYAFSFFLVLAATIHLFSWGQALADLVFLAGIGFFFWLASRSKALAFKLPMSAKFKDPNNTAAGRDGTPEGIMYIGNVKDTNEEIWFTNSDIRTHFLYLGTTGAGKTEGLKSMVTNALTWGSGFVFIDGKADTDLWSSLSSLVRRFGRDDDLMVLNYMTGNTDIRAPSNTMNPFSSGSASYLTNMLVELMPEAEGDNAMWKERAVSLCSALMPVLTYKRDKQDMPLSVRIIRENLTLNNVIKLSRDETVPSRIREGLEGYLDTLPGYVPDAFDDKGQIKPPGPDTPQYDTTTCNQQHGYLAMQFTRALQSLGDDYGYIFDTQDADVDMVDIVLNRRILVVLIPALEKSNDEIANLGKIVAATLKGMMGSTLGSTVEGASEKIIENKPTHSSTPFITVFDEVGYYTAAGMAVMAAQARSLGFGLVFAGQDLPALKKRVREEANSITGNCNIKIFGKLEDPTETKEFFEKTVGTVFVSEVSGWQMTGGQEFRTYFDQQQSGVQERAVFSYEAARDQKEGEAVITYGSLVLSGKVFYANPGTAKAMRVTRFLALPRPDDNMIKHADEITTLRDLMVDKSWSARKADVDLETPPEVEALNEGFTEAEQSGGNHVEAGISALVKVHLLTNPEDLMAEEVKEAAPPPAKPKAPSDTDKTEAKGPDWKEIIEKPPAEKTPEEEPKPAEGKPKVVKSKSSYKLPQEIEDIIKAAALKTKKSIFNDPDDE